MSSPSTDLLKIIHDTKAVSIWNRKTGPVFWYAAGVPGPFYVNTELVIGPALANELLEKITSIIAGSNDPATRVAQLNQAILTDYESTPSFKTVIAAMVAKAKEEFPAGTYTLVSGGERRDWLFSIPFAKEMGIRHLFLFKNQTSYCEQGITAGEKPLHVADLINNAASYFDLWLPALQKAKLACAGTLCVNSRGSNGVQKLEASGVKVVTLNSIDISFFGLWLKNGLIDQATYDELTTFFTSSKEWGAKYLVSDVALYAIDKMDKKSFERLRGFFNQDPWGLRKGNEAFFAAMQDAINQHSKAA